MIYPANPLRRLSGNRVPSHEFYIQRAIALASQAESDGEVPVGALIVYNHKIISESQNQSIINQDPTAHAEICALRKAALNLKNYRLNNTILYITKEPCIMCAGAIVHARVKQVVFGAYDKKSGAGGSVFNLLQAPNLNHQVEVISGVLEAACREQLQDFFRKRRG